MRALAEAQALCAEGRSADALAALEAAYAAGCRYRDDWLTRDARLAPLAADPGFADLVARASARYEADAADARPRLVFAMPDAPPDAFGYPLLVVLHGNNSSADETAPLWCAMADKGWVVAVPQSSEIGPTPGSFLWNDRERAARELDLHLERVKNATQVDVSRIVLAGFSMGGTQAIALALTKRFLVRGVVTVCAWLGALDEFTRLIDGGAGRMLRCYHVVGELDRSRDATRRLVDQLKAHGVRAELDERAGLGHEYPGDMEETLTKALAFVAR